MTKQLLSILFVVFAHLGFSQVTLTIADPDYSQTNPLNCAGIVPTGGTNFIDGVGNYLPNTDQTLVLCPDLTQGSKVSISFATNIGFEFDIHPTDTLYVYDGPSTSAPLLGAFNSGTNPVGFFVQASFQNNPSGCLTLRFRSNGASEGTGWVANVACGNPPQPIEPHIEAFKNGVGTNILNPLDTGYVDLCFGDSVLLTATPLFPYSLENTNTGYSQTVANCNYTWTIGGVGQFTGSSVWFTPPAQSGYYVDLKVQDAFPHQANIHCKVRVSQTPLFTGTGPLADTVCLGVSTNLIGGVTATDTVGIDIPGGEFQIGGVFAGLTFLPDGAGQTYSSVVPMSGFDSTTVITSANDFDQLCIDIEHSYIGDIEIALTCPNGTTVSIMNAYNQTPAGWNELVPGGCGNGISTFLGNDTNIDGGNPGTPVWTYCFSPTNATLGTICAEEALGNTILNSYGFASMNPNGVYLPDGDFNQFAGCPVNGPWTISVQDNQGIDDGYIFQWAIYFNSALYPESEGYQNIVMSDFWTSDPSIISGQTDTLIVIQPSVTGNTNYTYNVTDNFGCHYDTTVTLYVLPTPSIFSDTLACNYVFQAQNTISYSGGVWACADTSVHFLPSNLVDNPEISTMQVGGIFDVMYIDNSCNDTVVSQIEFAPYIYTELLDTSICLNANFELNPLRVNSQPLQAGYNPLQTFVWGDGSTTVPRIVNQPGDYTFYLSNACYTVSDVSTIKVKPCDITAPNILSLSSNSGNESFFVEYDGIAEFQCYILNRWGNVIYEYSDPAGKWNGKTSSGDLVEEGTYFYRIDAVFEGGEKIQKHGFVVVKY
jgi:subtilisin-like proprotein convertase family protein